MPYQSPSLTESAALHPATTVAAMGRSWILLLALLLASPAVRAAVKPGAEADTLQDEEMTDPGTSENDESGNDAQLSTSFKETLKKADYHFQGDVINAYVMAQKQLALAAIQKMNKAIPAEFLAWVDGDSVVRTTVYGSPKPANVLLTLYSLSIDVGSPRYQRYKNWLLAAAVKNSQVGPQANLSPRPPLKLVVPGDPRQPVNTKDTNRKLDLNDHIINFLEDNKLIASDVMYDGENKKVGQKLGLQKKFNEYMAAKGFPKIKVDCTFHLGQSKKNKQDAIRAVIDAYTLFQNAYEAKGRIPKKGSDPNMSLAQWVVFHVNDHEQRGEKARFPLDQAPWPVLTAMLNPGLSLREADAINHGSGDIMPGNRYKYNVAVTRMLDAVDVRPFPFSVDSWFMTKKHGGACGTRAGLAAKENKAKGIPSAPVGEIGHASWMEIGRSKFGIYSMHFQGGGHNPNTLSIHLPLPISRGKAGGQESAANWIAFIKATQNDAQVTGYMESMMAYYTLQSLTNEERAKYGEQLKADALILNPGNLLLSGIIPKNSGASAAARQAERKRKK